ncbi:MAG: hypothetical protein ACKVT0_03395 [Planctomycetaceae bacterium]
MELARGKELGTELMLLLSESGAVDRIQLAGSIRRLEARASDIEIVAEPHGDGGHAGKSLERFIEGAIDDPDTPLTWDEDLKRRGPRYKRLRWKGEPVDLFIVLPPAQWGAILTIRTGPVEFVKMLMGSRKYGGFMPSGIVQRDGALWTLQRYAPPRKVETPTEEEYFHALGLAWIPPEQRTIANLLKHQVHAEW